jgi:hypothetical protein
MADMLPSRNWRLCAFVLAVASVVPSLSAVVAEGRLYHGKMVQCIHGGSWFAAREGPYCGTEGYEQVFIGTVQSATEISDTDKRLQIIPSEVFVGNPVGLVTATVNQACLTPNEPEIKAGDKWLFYLRTRKYLHPYGNPAYITSDGRLELSYDSPSERLSGNQRCLTALRVARTADSGAVIDAAYHGALAGRITLADGRAAKYAHVAIVPVSPRGVQFTVFTDQEGHFEVRGQQPGSYLVGVGLLAEIGSSEWKSRVYYPGVPTREEAKVIELGDGERRTNIDFKLPPTPIFP